MRKLLIAALLLASSTAFAGTASDTMTNIVTVAGSCSVLATGVNFGVLPRPIPATGWPGIAPNLNDIGSLTLLGVAVPPTSAAGVYVVCTVTPTSVTMSGPSGGQLNLPTAAGVGSGVYAGKMTGPGGSIDYTMTFTGATFTTPLVGIYAMAYVPLATIPYAQSSSFGGGNYSEVVVVNVNL